MKKEHHIPIDKDFLLDFCTEENKFEENQKKGTNELFRILEQYFHFEGFKLNQLIKKNYFGFDPDRIEELKLGNQNSGNLAVFKENVHSVLARGKYVQIDNSFLEEAMSKNDIIGLKLKIDFEHFKEYKVFTRGSKVYKEKIRHLYFWQKEKEVESFERVVVYIEYKDKSYFEQKKIDYSKLSIQPGTIILKSFKRVPKNDLESIFPNAVPVMTPKDKVLLWIPALAGGLILFFSRILPSIIVTYRAYQKGEAINTEELEDTIFQVAVALGFIGYYVIRQFKRFLHKKIEFSKKLTESLYFKNIANNAGVFPSLIQEAEEEEIKETIIAYIFLYKSDTHLSIDELDEKIEKWFKNKMNCDVDFDVENALRKLQQLGIGLENDGRWHVKNLDEALTKANDIRNSILL
jgi:hypothetical protein